MSRAAAANVAYRLSEIRRAGVGETGLALIVYLADRADKKGEVFMMAETMREDTGTATIREMRRTLAKFIKLGWLTPTGETIRYKGRGKPTPVYGFTFTPGLWKGAQPEPISDRIGAELVTDLVTEETPETGLKRSNDAETGHGIALEPEPQPQPGAPGETGREWGDTHEQIFTYVWAWEPHDNDRGHLQRHVRSDYRPIICNLVARYPDGDPDYLAEKAYSARNNGRPAPGARSAPSQADWRNFPTHDDADRIDAQTDPETVQKFRDQFSEIPLQERIDNDRRLKDVARDMSNTFRLPD